MKTLKITPPSGFEIDKDKSTFEEIVFKPIDNWVNSWDELGYKELNAHSDLSLPGSLLYNIEQYINLQKLRDLRDHVNQGWTPDWMDGSAKWCILSECKRPKVTALYQVNSVLNFKDKVTAQRFLETHLELIESVKELL